MATVNGNKRRMNGKRSRTNGTDGRTNGTDGRTNGDGTHVKVTGLLSRMSPQDFAASAEVKLVPGDLVGLALVLHVALDGINELAPPCSCGRGRAEYVVGTLDGMDVTLQQMLVTALNKLNAPLPVSAVQHDHDSGGEFQ